MESKETNAEDAVFQVKQETNGEQSFNSHIYKSLGDWIPIKIKNEFSHHADLSLKLLNHNSDEELLSDIVKEEYVQTYPDANQHSFEHQLKDVEQSVSLNPRDKNTPSTIEVVNLAGASLDLAKYFECFCCRQTFMTEAQLKNHLSRKCFRRFECNICGRKFKCDAYLKTHRHTHFPRDKVIKKEPTKIENSSSNSFVCSEPGCEKTFSRKDRLLVHLRIHTGDKRYQCDEDGCLKKFNEWSNLDKHRRIHAGHKRFICDEPGCGKKFTVKCNLMEHKNIHVEEKLDKETGSKNGGKPYTCEICGSSMRYQSSISKHVKMHSGEKPYACEQEGCNKRFLRKYHLTRHSYVHIDGMRYMCTNLDCNKQYRDRGAFKKHVQSHGNDN